MLGIVGVLLLANEFTQEMDTRIYLWLPSDSRAILEYWIG